MKAKFTKGMKVIKVLHGAGLASKEEGIIEKVSGNKVWLVGDEDMNNDTAFVNGVKTGVFGFWEEIILP